MEGKPRSPFYFSAYRLKTLEESSSLATSTKQSPYLKALLSGKTRTTSRVRVFPMINPYKQKMTSTDADASQANGTS